MAKRVGGWDGGSDLGLELGYRGICDWTLANGVLVFLGVKGRLKLLYGQYKSIF